ncbi:hypothetical protein HQ584_09165 [Patescibacteria group bacterium]|nr:hypothetical protein [Patescibacteria group bacterium]
MTTEKQIEANRINAQKSTGPKTDTGKAIVSKNAIVHGIFSRDLLIANGDGQESLEDFEKLYQNLVECLNPNGQMEYLLVEKIAVDTWRLKRVLRFETGSIQHQLDAAIEDQAYKTDQEVALEIKQTNEKISYNQKYIECFQNEKVSFEQPFWQGSGISIDIKKELKAFFDSEGLELSDNAILLGVTGDFDFSDMLRIIRQNHYSDKDICKFLVQKAEKENIRYRRDIKNLETRTQRNAHAEDVSVRLRSLPQDNGADKVLRYDKAIQKSIYQNLMLLKLLQGNG